jgi:hypothetical protein
MMSILKTARLLPKARAAQLALELGAIYMCLQGVLPAALAVYPQVSVFLSI